MFDVSANIRARKVCDRRYACALPGETMPLSTAVVLVVEDSPLILMNALELVTAGGFEDILPTVDAKPLIAAVEIPRQSHVDLHEA